MTNLVGPIQHKHGTTQQWASSNVPLRDGELGIDSTLRRMEVGDGATLWAGLPWSSMGTDEVARLEAAAAALEGATAQRCTSRSGTARALSVRDARSRAP